MNQVGKGKMDKNLFQQILGTISNEASQNAGAFLIKSLELQQAIEQSTRDYKIFWGWLYGVIIRFLEESVPDEVAAVSQQDITYLAEFLNTFDENEDHGEGKLLLKFSNFIWFLLNLIGVFQCSQLNHQA